MVPLVRAHPAVRLGQFDAVILDLVDGTDMDAVGADNLHMFADVFDGHDQAPCGSGEEKRRTQAAKAVR